MKIRSNKTKYYGIDGCENRRKPGIMVCEMAKMGKDRQRRNHINAVDAVTQFQAVVSVRTTSESHLLPQVQELLAYFPFWSHGFHSRNGSEYVNCRLGELLENFKLNSPSPNVARVSKFKGY